MSSESKTIYANYLVQGVPEPDAAIMDEYFEKLAYQSTNSLDGMSRELHRFYEFVNYISVTGVRVEDARSYVEKLKTSGLSDTSCDTIFRYLKTWFNVIKRGAFARGITIINVLDYVENPFKKTKIKTNGDKKINIDLDFREEVVILTDKEMDTIIECARTKKRWMYIAFLILKYTGMRPSELVSIRIENININDRVIASGTEKDHAKSGNVTYFVPARIASEIKSYMLAIDGEWLFPSARTLTGYISDSNITYAARIISKKTGIAFTAYSFRHTIISRRRLIGVSVDDNHVLMNHAPQDIEGKHYESYSIRERRDLYDRCNPYH